MSQHAVDGRVVKPVTRLLDLVSKGILRPLEDVLPSSAWEEVSQSDPEPSDLERLLDFFEDNPRAISEAAFKDPAHGKFHDTMRL